MNRHAPTYPPIDIVPGDLPNVPVWTFDLYGNPANPQRDRARAVTRRRQRRSW